MAKLLKTLKLGRIAQLIADREKRIADAPAQPVPPLDSYIQNQLKNQLHPKVQHLVVSQIVEHGADAKTFYLSPDAARGTTYLGYPAAGQYLSIRQEVDGKAICRPYSLSSSPKEAREGHYTLTIKRVKDGKMSNFALDNWVVGTTMDTSGPLGVFTYEPLRDAPTVIGLAGGSGITPFYSMAKAIVDGDEDFRLILIYGSRSQADALFAKEFDELQAASNGKFSIVHVLSDEVKEGCEHGFITADLIKKYAPADAYSVFMCGPQAMYTFVDKELEKLQLRRKYIRHELFGEYRHPEQNADYPKEAEGKTFKLHVKMWDEHYDIDCRWDETLLNAMERNGVAAPSDCRSGICGWCRSRLVEGQVYVPVSVDGRRKADLQYGYVHPCCTFALSDIYLDVPKGN
jgi:ferredoxin-NADP reductase